MLVPPADLDTAGQIDSPQFGPNVLTVKCPIEKHESTTSPSLPPYPTPCPPSLCEKSRPTAGIINERGNLSWTHSTVANSFSMTTHKLDQRRRSSAFNELLTLLLSYSVHRMAWKQCRTGRILGKFPRVFKQIVKYKHAWFLRKKRNLVTFRHESL